MHQKDQFKCPVPWTHKELILKCLTYFMLLATRFLFFPVKLQRVKLGKRKIRFFRLAGHCPDRGVLVCTVRREGEKVERHFGKRIHCKYIYIHNTNTNRNTNTNTKTRERKGRAALWKEDPLQPLLLRVARH